jgi:hypothetical protein
MSNEGGASRGSLLLLAAVCAAAFGMLLYAVATRAPLLGVVGIAGMVGSVGLSAPSASAAEHAVVETEPPIVFFEEPEPLPLDIDPPIVFFSEPEPVPEPVPLAAAPTTPAAPAPATLAPSAVLAALLDELASPDVLAVHVWLRDPWSARLRCVGSAGILPPSPSPLLFDDAPLGMAIEEEACRIGAVHSIRHDAGEPAVRRVAMPVRSDEERAVVAVDVMSQARPDAAAVEACVARMTPALAAALAAHIRQAETAASRRLLDAIEALDAVDDPATALRVALEHALAIHEGVAASAMLAGASGQLRVAEVAGAAGPDGADLRTLADIAEWALATGRPVVVEDLPKPGVTPLGAGIVSTACVPMGADGRLIGVVNVGCSSYPGVPLGARMDALTALAGHAALTLRRVEGTRRYGAEVRAPIAEAEYAEYWEA